MIAALAKTGIVQRNWRSQLNNRNQVSLIHVTWEKVWEKGINGRQSLESDDGGRTTWARSEEVVGQVESRVVVDNVW